MSKATESIENRLRKADPAAQKASIDSHFTNDPVEVGINRAKGSRGQLRHWFINRSANFKRAFVGGGFAGVAAATVAAILVVNLGHAPLISLAGDRGRQHGLESKLAGVGDAALSMIPFNNVEYIVGDGISDATGSGHVYELKLNGSPESRLQQLAAAFGMKGEVMAMPESYGQPDGYIFADPAAGSVEKILSSYQSNFIQITWNSGGYWSYYPGTAYPNSSGCAKSSDDAATDDNCVQPTPGPGIEKSKAIALALKIFKASGLDITAADIEFSKDDYYATATTSLKVDGQETAITYNATWDSYGNFTGAMGQSVVAVDRGEFGTISAKNAIENRLRDYRWNGQLPQSVWNEVGPILYRGTATDDMVVGSGESVAPDASGSGESTEGSTGEEPAPPVMVEPGEKPTDQPIEPMPVTQKITVTSAKAMLVTIYDATGNAWLVPGYLLKGTDNWLAGVVSVVDGVIELPKQDDIRPMDGMRK